MAFDFLNYISQQVGQQQPTLLAGEEKSFKHRYIIHLVAFQLNQLMQCSKKDSTLAYQKIQQLDADWLVQLSTRQIEQDTVAATFFQHIQSKIAESHQKIAALILNELSQLDQTAQLGALGINELLDGQYPWLQQEVEPWFWDSIGHPEFKITREAQQPDTDFNQVMKEFSQIIQQQAQQPPEHDTHLLIDDSNTTPQQASCFYRIINPVIAISIILFLFKSII